MSNERTWTGLRLITALTICTSLLLAGCGGASTPSPAPSASATSISAGSSSSNRPSGSNGVETPPPVGAVLTLKSLTINGQALTFNGTAYTLTVPASTLKVEAIVVTTDPTVSVAIGTGAYSVGTLNTSLQLLSGANTFAIRLLNPDKHSARFSLVITRG